MINERSRLYNPAAKGWNSSKFINFLPAAVQDIPGISHEAANLIINATSIREYGVACLSSSSQRRRAPHKLLPSRDTQARKLYSFLVSISSLIPGHRMQISPQPRLDGRILAAIFFPSSTPPSILDTGEDRRKSVLYGGWKVSACTPYVEERNILKEIEDYGTVCDVQSHQRRQVKDYTCYCNLFSEFFFFSRARVSLSLFSLGE